MPAPAAAPLPFPALLPFPAPLPLVPPLPLLRAFNANPFLAAPPFFPFFPLGSLSSSSSDPDPSVHQAQPSLTCQSASASQRASP